MLRKQRRASRRDSVSPRVVLDRSGQFQRTSELGEGLERWKAKAEGQMQEGQRPIAKLKDWGWYDNLSQSCHTPLSLRSLSASLCPSLRGSLHTSLHPLSGNPAQSFQYLFHVIPD